MNHFKRNKRNRHHEFIATGRTDFTDLKLPDWLQGSWTQPNDNPVIFEYKYNGYYKDVPFLDYTPINAGRPLLQEWTRLEAFNMFMAMSMGAASGAAGAAWWYDNIGTLVGNLWEKFIGSSKVIQNIFSVFFGEDFFSGMGGAGLAASSVALTLQQIANQNLIKYVEAFQDKVREAKQHVDNDWVYNSEGEKLHHKYRSATIHFEGTFEQHLVVGDEYQLIKKGTRYVETYSMKNNLLYNWFNQELTSIFKGLGNVQGPTITYENY